MRSDMKVTFYHYVKGVNTELKSCLQSALNGDSEEITIDNSFSIDPDKSTVALVHQSRKNDVSEKLTSCDLIILFSEGKGSPKENNSTEDKKTWDCGTEVLIKYFSKLKGHIEKCDSKDDWRYDAWVPKFPEYLVAAYLLQCANLSDQCPEIEKADLPDGFWQKTLQEFTEQTKKEGFTDIIPPERISLKLNMEIVDQLLDKLAEAQAA